MTHAQRKHGEKLNGIIFYPSRTASPIVRMRKPDTAYPIYDLLTDQFPKLDSRYPTHCPAPYSFSLYR